MIKKLLRIHISINFYVICSWIFNS